MSAIASSEMSISGLFRKKETERAGKIGSQNFSSALWGVQYRDLGALGEAIQSQYPGRCLSRGRKGRHHTLPGPHTPNRGLKRPSKDWDRRMTLASVVSLHQEESIDQERPVLIDAGVYDAVLVNWKVNYSGYFRKHVLLMHFRIVDMGEYHGVVLPAWFNVKHTKSKTTIKAGWRSDFLRMYQECFDIQLKRTDRISMAPFHNVLLKGEVITIEKDTKGQPLGKINHYSRIKRCLSVIK